jgi:phenylacetate-CoA ligase
VLTNLGRVGSPLIRYRTGDLVRVATSPDPTGRTWRRLDGGILGRADDMIHVRGNNLYPSAIEAIVRRFAEVAEYRIHVDRTDPLADVRLEIEPVRGDGRALAEAVGKAVRDELLFRVDVTPCPPGSLPRFEMKARRVVHQK